MNARPQLAELTSWKDIADYLGVNVRTAQKWETQKGLPVHRSTGEKARVWALPAELDNWKKVAAANPRCWNSLRFLRCYAMAASLIAAGALSIIAGDYWVHHRRGPPALFKAEYSTLTVMDTRGREVWRSSFEQPFSSMAYVGDEGQQRIWFGDIDGDSGTETLFAYYPGKVESMGASLVCFGEDGREKWRFRPKAVTDRQQTYAPHYIISGFDVVDLGAGRGRQIAVTSRHAVHHPNHFTLLDGRGATQSEYWHSGHLDYMNFMDVDGDGVKEVLLTGVNNGHNAATLVVLDPRDFNGASDQGKGSPYQLQGLPLAKEKAVVLFGRTCLNRKFEIYNMGRFIRVHGGLMRLEVYERGVGDGLFVIYTLDRNLKVLKAQPTDTFRSLHRTLQGEGVLDHPLTDQEIEALAKVRILKKSW
ncbi:MAG: hypothetical protein AAB225_24050 [Acidobacteriota bacterium]